jgi:phosphoribosylformylglycinamidine synthase subunit PurQ / glutaminase
MGGPLEPVFRAGVKMATCRVLVLRAAGTNCDVETAYAWTLAGAEADRVHINALAREPQMLRRYQALTVPGGFSYGDDIAAGKIFANQLLHHVAGELEAFRDRGGLILGICNGFQVLTKAGLLPNLPVEADAKKQEVAAGPGVGRSSGSALAEQGVDVAPARQQATLTWNDTGRYQDLWVHLKVATDHCVFLQAGQMLYLPVAHAEGKVLFPNEQVRQTVHAQKMVALQYVDQEGNFGGWPINPNGSTDHIAGLTDPTGRILGLMPHPERFIDPTQHPHWTRLPNKPQPDGRSLFDNAVRYLQQA